MEQTKVAIYQLSSLSPDAELLLTSAITKVFGQEVMATERPAVLKDIYDKVRFSRIVGGEISPEFFSNAGPVIIAGSDNEENAKDMLKTLMWELDSVRKGNRGGYASIIGIPMEPGEAKLSKSIEQVAQGIVSDVEEQQREPRLIREPAKYFEEKDVIRLTGNNVGMAYVAGLALDKGISVNYTQNLGNNSTTVTFRNPEEYAQVFMPVGHGENGNFVYANVAAASQCVMTFDDAGKVSGIAHITADTNPEDIRKTCEYLTVKPKTEEAELACEYFCEQVERDSADIRADICRSGSDAIAASTAGKGELPSCQIDFVERNYNIRTTYGAVAQPAQQHKLLNKIATQARYMSLAIAMRNAVEREWREHELRVKEAELKKLDEEKARRELEERIRKEREEEERRKQERMNLLFNSTMALTIAAVFGVDGREWLRRMMQEQGINNLANMYSVVRAEELQKNGVPADVVEKVKGNGSKHHDVPIL